MFRNRTTIWNVGPILATAIVVVAMGASSVKADFTFGKPVNLTTVIPVLDPMNDNVFSFSADGLEMYILSFRAGCDIWVLRRDSKDADWPPPERLGPAVNDPNGAYSPQGIGPMS